MAYQRERGRRDREDYDVAIVGGTIVDGTGKEPWRGDVALREGRIVAVGELPSAAVAADVVDADGCWVTPGLIDPHTHLDARPLGVNAAGYVPHSALRYFVMGERARPGRGGSRPARCRTAPGSVGIRISRRLRERSPDRCRR